MLNMQKVGVVILEKGSLKSTQIFSSFESNTARMQSHSQQKLLRQLFPALLDTISGIRRTFRHGM